eukprot:SAG31_NODE_3402_length_4313_cov_7.421690_1_plen_414_part_00
MAQFITAQTEALAQMQLQMNTQAAAFEHMMAAMLQRVQAPAAAAATAAETANTGAPQPTGDRQNTVAPNEAVGSRPTLKQSKAIESCVEEHVQLHVRNINDLNATKAAIEALQKLTFDEDPKIPLPAGTPKEILSMKAPRLKLHKGMALDETKSEQLAAAQTKVDTQLRATQLEMLKQMITCKNESIDFINGDREKIGDRLRNAVSELMRDTLITAADQLQLSREAAEKYAADTRAATVKIEAKRKAQLAEKARKAKELETEQFKQLERDNAISVGAFVEKKITAALALEQDRRRSATFDDNENMDTEANPESLMRENTEFEKQHAAAAKTQAKKPKNGKPPRAPLAAGRQNQQADSKKQQQQTKKQTKKKPAGKQKQQKQQPADPSKQNNKGNAKGKGKGKSKRGGGKGGRS